MQDLDDNTFEERIYDNGEKCLVMFSRTDCHVCKEVHPLVEELEGDYKDTDFRFYHVDVEAQKDLFSRFSLKGVPQVLFFDDGEFVGKLAGKKEDEAYIDKIDENLAS